MSMAVVGEWIGWLACRASGLQSSMTPAIGRRQRFTRWLAVGILVMATTPVPAGAGVLSESDFKKVEEIKPAFQTLMTDLVQTSKRADIPSADADCISSTIRELLQISEELSSYEYLITIEKEMTDFGEDGPTRGIVKFAIEKTNIILSSERKRLSQLSDTCSRFPLAFGKTQQALRFIDSTTNILSSIQLRL